VGKQKNHLEEKEIYITNIYYQLTTWQSCIPWIFL